MPTIAVVCTLNELRPYSIRSAAAKANMRYFSVNVSVSFTAGGGGRPVDAVFQPWNWTQISINAYTDNQTAGAMNPPAGAMIRQNLITPVTSATTLMNATAGAIEARLASSYIDNLGDPNYFVWADQPGQSTGAAGENWSRLLAHASTYTAPIPHALNLTFLFKIPAAQLQRRLFIAPLFTAGNVIYTPNQNGPETPDQFGGVEWQYQNPPVLMSVFQPEFALPDLKPQAKKSYIDFDTYLIATVDGTDIVNPPESSASEDWRATLERRAAEAFDLPQRTLIALRNGYFPGSGPATPLPAPGDLANIRDALLASMRDSADFGLRVAPDGTNLLIYVLERAVDGLTAADTSVYATALVAADRQVSIDNWKKTLTNVLGLSNVNDPITNSNNTRSVLNALDTVRSALTKDDNLALLLFAQWDAVLTGVGSWASIRLAVQQELKDLSTSHTLRSRYLLANLGGDSAYVPIWRALIDMHGVSGYVNEKNQINSNFSSLLPAYFRGRMVESASNAIDSLFNGRFPTSPWPENAKGIPDPDLSVSLQADASKTDLAPDLSAQPTRVPHPVIIQIGDTQTVDDLTDPTRQISGVGLLIKEQNAGTTYWTGANVANVYARTTTGKPPVAGFTQCLSGMFVPVRATTRNNLKQPFLVYNNGSLVGQDALVDQNGAQSDPASEDMEPEGGIFPASADKNDWQHLFQYRLDPPNCKVTFNGNKLEIPPFVQPDGSDWKRVPSLKVNEQVRETFLPFVIGVGGALPPLLAASLDDPITPVSPTQFATNWNAARLSGYLRTITYRRRVGVGKVRLRRKSATDTDIQHELPDFPSTVVPIAQDFGLTLPKSSGSGSQVRSTPILLLWTTSDAEKTQNRDHGIFNFKVRPPACDLETFDRWVAGLPEHVQTAEDSTSYRNTRVAVATAIRFGGPKAQAGVPPVENGFGPDFSIDDPAVTQLIFTLTQVFPKPGQHDPVIPPVIKNLKALAQLSSEVPLPANPNDIPAALLSPVQTDGVKVLCSIGPVGCQPGDPNPDTPVNVTVPKGQIWRLTVAPGVPELATKFEGFAAQNHGGNFELLIESVDEGSFAVSAPSTTPTAVQESLWQSLVPAFGNDGAVTATFNPPTFNPPTNDVNLIRFVDLRRQSWRWTGRPVSPLPGDWNGGNIDADPAYSAANPHVPNSMLWEVGSFGERDDEDAGTTAKAVNYLLSTPAINLFSTSLANDLRAQYWRFAVDVHSRYEGLPGLQIVPLTARHAITDSQTNVKGFTEWRRLVVPPRLKSTVAGVPTPPVPKPKILMVIPLTQPHSPATHKTLQTPDLLVVANEPWFQTAGLAEELRAELEPARDPSVPLSLPTAFANPIPEIGPGQTLTGKPFDVKFGPQTHLAAEPIGTTFDLATSAPLFGNTCFKLKSSMLAWNSQFPPSTRMEYFQAKVRFRRVINATKWGGADDLRSDPTDAFLVEFQPSFVHCNVKALASDGSGTWVDEGPISVTDLTFSISGANLSFSWQDSQDTWHQGVQLVPGPPRTDLFVPANLKLWALVMQKITDAFGNQQLAPVDMLPQSADGKSFTFSITPANLPDQTSVVVYLLQVRDTGSNPPNRFPSLGELLFRSDNDTPVQITGCSSQVIFRSVS